MWSCKKYMTGQKLKRKRRKCNDEVLSLNLPEYLTQNFGVKVCGRFHPAGKGVYVDRKHKMLGKSTGMARRRDVKYLF